MDANPGPYNKPDGAGAAHGAGSVPASGGEPSPPGIAPVLPTEQTSSNLDLTRELEGVMEQDEKGNARIRATKRKVRSPLSQEEGSRDTSGRDPTLFTAWAEGC